MPALMRTSFSARWGFGFFTPQAVATDEDVPVAVTAIAFIIGLLVLPASEETEGKPLPA